MGVSMWGFRFVRIAQGIRTGYLFRFLCTDDGETVLYAQFVRNLPHPSYIGFFIAAVLFPVLDRYGIPDDMVE